MTKKKQEKAVDEHIDGTVEQNYTWTNNTDVNLSVIAYNNNDDVVCKNPTLKPEAQFKSTKAYSYVVIEKPMKQTFYVGKEINQNNMKANLLNQKQKTIVFKA